MFAQFTERATRVMALADKEAKRLNHQYVGSEHILLGVVGEGTGVGGQMLKRLNIELADARREVARFVKPGPEMVTMGRLPMTPRATQVVTYAAEEASTLKHRYVGTEHLLLGLVREKDGVAAHVLRALGLDLDRLRAELLAMLGAPVAEGDAVPNRLVDGCPLCERLVSLVERADGALIEELRETYVVLGQNQGCRGWCVLILKGHEEHVAELGEKRRRGMWEDVSEVAAAIRRVFATGGKGGGPVRINYECLGNLVPHVHWHVIPRHGDDPEPTKAVWGWSEERLRGTMGAGERARLVGELRAAMGR